MTEQEILSRVDHTLLKTNAGWEAIKKICDESIQYKTASVCIPPSFVKRIHEQYGQSVNICTVAGFPLGYSIPAVKAFEAERAVKEGAAELDMVINIGDVKDGHFDRVLEEIILLRQTLSGSILKVIIETCYLSEDEKIRLCDIVTEAGADYIKTSTGLASGGATLADIELFKKHVGPKVKVKAAGGIRTREEMESFINAGADRIGASSAVSVLTGIK
jgi:deoxyribose-phosphate aldolase